TAVSAERRMVNIIKRAQYLCEAGENLNCSEGLTIFLKQCHTLADFSGSKNQLLETFGSLDDNDIWGALKLWRNHPDEILSGLCNRLLLRELFQIRLTPDPIRKAEIEKIRTQVYKSFGILRKDASYLFSFGKVSNEAYVTGGKAIHILTKDGSILDIAHASDLPTIKAISKIVQKNYLCWPKNIYL
ncbi:MAG: phosphohydrolase, partial [Flammeovirgaceae bacterium]